MTVSLKHDGPDDGPERKRPVGVDADGSERKRPVGVAAGQLELTGRRADDGLGRLADLKIYITPSHILGTF